MYFHMNGAYCTLQKCPEADKVYDTFLNAKCVHVSVFYLNFHFQIFIKNFTNSNEKN